MVKKHYNRFRRFCAFLTGFVFLTSGILKLMDPTGTEMVMRAYYSFFHIGFMNWSAKAAGVILSLLEATVGAALVSGVWRKVTAIVTCALTGFFTLLTLVLLIFNPAFDCGCFGEFIHLTHLQTFIKNIVLCALCCGAFIPMKDLGEPKKVKYVAFAICLCSVTAFMIYSLIELPLKEFTDFETGARIAAAETNDNTSHDSDADLHGIEEHPMIGSAQENADRTADGETTGGETAGGNEMFKSVFVYEKDGKQVMFTLENLPDSSWTFVETRTERIDNGFPANPVFSIMDSDGEYCDSLAADGVVMVISFYKKPCGKALAKAHSFAKEAESRGIRTILVSADSDTPYRADFKTLATINRSNGGTTLINNGVIAAKWSYHSMAGARNFEKSMDKFSTASMEAPDELAAARQTKRSLAMQGFLLYIFSVLLLL